MSLVASRFISGSMVTNSTGAMRRHSSVMNGLAGYRPGRPNALKSNVRFPPVADVRPSCQPASVNYRDERLSTSWGPVGKISWVLIVAGALLLMFVTFDQI